VTAGLGRGWSGGMGQVLELSVFVRLRPIDAPRAGSCQERGDTFQA
jgi:hypothetical protein